ncbi:MAG: hypothetical protein ACTHM1_05945 [Solirubrobacteraceae bacterium]
MLECAPLKRWLLAFACCAAPLVAASPGFASPGDLDPSFGDGGEFRFQANPACNSGCVEFFGSYASTVALQHDGKILLGGRNVFFGSPEEPVPPTELVRLNANGTLDDSFGNGGVSEGPPFDLFHLYETERSDLLAVGERRGVIGVERFTRTGAEVDAVGEGGVHWLHTQQLAEGAQVDGLGRIVVVAGTPGDLLRPIEVRRFLPDGTPDRRFGSDGLVALHVLSPVRPIHAQKFIVEADGSLMVLGTNGQTLFLARLKPNGKLDRSFGARHGVAIIPSTLNLYYDSLALAVAPDGRAFIAVGDESSLLLMRFTAHGRFDRAFGHEGFSSVTTFADHPAASSATRTRAKMALGISSAVPTGIAFDRGGAPVVLGSYVVPTIDNGSAGTWFLARYARGGLDCSFGNRGVVLGDGRGEAAGLALQPDDKIVIAGNSEHAFMAARYLGGGTPHTCPGEGAPPNRPHTNHHRRRKTRRR